jgi:hypothetical protein
MRATIHSFEPLSISLLSNIRYNIIAAINSVVYKAYCTEYNRHIDISIYSDITYATEFRREDFYNILTEFGVLNVLNKAYNKIHTH